MATTPVSEEMKDWTSSAKKLTIKEEGKVLREWYGDGTFTYLSTPEPDFSITKKD